MLLMTNGQPFYWNNPTTPSYTPTADGNPQNTDERILKIERMLNSFPGRVARKIYRGLRKVKHGVQRMFNR